MIVLPFESSKAGLTAFVNLFAPTPITELPICITPEVNAPWTPAWAALLNLSCIAVNPNSTGSCKTNAFKPVSIYSCANSSSPSLIIPAMNPFPSKREIPGIPPNITSVNVSEAPDKAPYKYACPVEYPSCLAWTAVFPVIEAVINAVESPCPTTGIKPTTEGTNIFPTELPVLYQLLILNSPRVSWSKFGSKYASSAINSCINWALYLIS